MKFCLSKPGLVPGITYVLTLIGSVQKCMLGNFYTYKSAFMKVAWQTYEDIFSKLLHRFQAGGFLELSPCGKYRTLLLSIAVLYKLKKLSFYLHNSEF